MEIFDCLFDYVKDRSLSWLKIPGPKKEDIQVVPFCPVSDWQFHTYPGETIVQDGKTYIRINWLDVGEKYLAETELNTYLYARCIWNEKRNVYQSDGKYYETEEDALQLTKKKTKGIIPPEFDSTVIS